MVIAQSFLNVVHIGDQQTDILLDAEQFSNNILEFRWLTLIGETVVQYVQYNRV